MNTILDQEEFAKNIYVIRRKLAELRPVRSSGHYEYVVGKYTVHIYTYEIQDVPSGQEANLLSCEKVSIVLNETTKSGVTSSISLRDDPIFKNYAPIQYDVIETPNGKINISDGEQMPILHLCELIRYLHRLSNLSAFM
jgi:hypothetical protein